MENSILHAIQNLTDAIINKTDPVIYAAIITIVGMLGTAILTTITQFIITNKVIKSDFKKMLNQLYTENQIKERNEWKDKLRIKISQFLAKTDPEINPDFKKESIVPLVHQIQLLLNLEDKSEHDLFNLITNFTLSINGWLGNSDLSQLLKQHGKISDQTRIIIQK